ncbi:DUF3710 domain-containing protein [Mycetocola zhadangensis]|uniref:DUF3710 domain-containing protein n=1 Tax=Mycetocola zhadangensis TaxID=1164595 RepID=A0A3L7J5Y2_9MICO|nr:DUF3710 domain-containing protein [Mycetocola zhadangensis]RLQ86067.1 DUF3710 domain-containing protein [Mycetocola zhadangensis]GGE88095.1 hypothetical protein GCM10011313_08450 [Mycetocola zhadangensis]
MSKKNKNTAAETELAADVTEPESAELEESSDAQSTAVSAVDAEDADALDISKSAPVDRATEGPFDESEANAVRPYIDLGGVKILPRDGLNLRLEVEESTKRIVAVGLDYAGSTLQIQPFAAPRSTGLWHETREQIQDQIARQGGTVTERDGTFGPELLAEVPVVSGSDGSAGTRIARFVGVDGPRWFLRGVIAGEAATNAEAAALVEDLFRSVVVVRGSSPMPPRDLIPLVMPPTAAPTD